MKDLLLVRNTHVLGVTAPLPNSKRFLNQVADFNKTVFKEHLSSNVQLHIMYNVKQH